MDPFTWAARAAGSAFVGLFAVSMLIAATTGDGPAIWLTLAIPSAIGSWFLWPKRKSWRHDAPSDRQLRYAADLGIRVRKGATKGEVSDLISQATGR